VPPRGVGCGRLALRPLPALLPLPPVRGGSSVTVSRRSLTLVCRAGNAGIASSWDGPEGHASLPERHQHKPLLKEHAPACIPPNTSVCYAQAASTWPRTWLLSWDEVRLASSMVSPAPDGGGGGVASGGAADVAESLGLAGLELAAAAAAAAVCGCTLPGGGAAAPAASEDTAAKGDTAPSGLSPASAALCAWLLAAAAVSAAGSRSGVFSCGNTETDCLSITLQ
jgi:hypothetical protein